MKFTSVVIVSYNIERELPRTLQSFSPAYQIGVDPSLYEVIVVDNGSKNPPRAEDFSHLGIDLTIIHQEHPTPSPVRAINTGLNAACGSVIGVFIDGARLASPGILKYANEAISLDERAIVATRGRYLGPRLQRDSVLSGYSKQVENEMLEEIRWGEDGYRLFEVSVFDESSGPTWVSPISESNGIFMSRACWWELNGFDTHFQSPGGGLANLDLWRRATALPDVRPTVLMGEATFHQLHGGVATNGTVASIENFFEEYARIRGYEYTKPDIQPHYLGRFAKRPPAKEMVGRVEERVRQSGSVLPARRDGGSSASFVGRVLRNVRPRAVMRRAKEKEWARIIADSPLFDTNWYLREYPEVAASRVSPALHYVRYGAFEGRNPGPGFNTAWYYERYPDVMDAGDVALVHYLLAGRSEGRRPAPARSVDADEEHRLTGLIENSEFFDAQWYLQTYPDVARLHLNPALHFLRYGRAQLRHPSLRFDVVRYLRENADVELTRDNPLVHYLEHGRAEGRRIHSVEEAR